MINTPNSKISNQIKCSICRTCIKNLRTIYQSSLKLGVICKSCKEGFSENDIEMIINIFFAYGGYFGQFDKSKFSMEDAILEFAEELGVHNASFQVQNVKLWHKILTHGITPEEFLGKLSGYVEH